MDLYSEETKPMLTEGQCFCHIPCVYLSGKDGQKVYTKCGRSKQDMKSGVRGCTLFCDEEEWTYHGAILERKSHVGVSLVPLSSGVLDHCLT